MNLLKPISFIYLKDTCIYLKVRVGQRKGGTEEGRERECALFFRSLTKWLQESGLVQANARRQELHPSLLMLAK